MSTKNTVLPVQTMLQSRGRLLSLEKPVLMGILNATPDSFYNKGRDSSLEALVEKAGLMLAQGAAILDIGGTTTKPGAAIIHPQEEQDKVLPVIEAIHKRYPDAWLSCDTYHSGTARTAVMAGVSIINDVSSGSIDSAMLATVAELKVPYIAMHMQGTPEIMQKDPQYDDVVTDVRNYLQAVCHKCAKAGIADVVIDPGFGFGKTVQHNFALLKQLHTFRMLGKPILAGISRKSMICRTLGVTPEEALNGTTALHIIALQQGANILRVHDVKEAAEVIQLYNAMQ